MRAIMVYDIEAKRLEKLADEKDTTIAELIEEMLDMYEEEESEE